MSYIVNPRLFGGNYVRGSHATTGPFPETLALLDMTHLRYGGGVIEDKFHPDENWRLPVTDASFNVGLAAFQREAEDVAQMASERGMNVCLVVPARNFDHPRMTEVVGAVRQLLARWRGLFNHVVIGNENFASHQTVERYIGAVNWWLKHLADIDVGRVVQAWPYYTDTDGKEAEQLADGIERGLRHLVSGTTIHKYIQTDPSNNYDKHWEFARLDAPFTVGRGYPRRMARLATEWGIAGADYPITGQEVAPALVRAFDQIVRNGIEEAWLWPVSHRFPTSPPGKVATAGWNWKDEVYLTPAGLVYQQLRLLEGLRRVRGTVERTVNVFDYAGPHRAVRIITNQGPAGTWGLHSPREFLPSATKAVVRRIWWEQNRKIAGTEDYESGAALGVLTEEPLAGSVQVTLRQHEVAFLVAEV